MSKKRSDGPPSQRLDQYIVRFPDGMRDWLKAEAEKSGRSMNAEIVYRLDLTRRFELDLGELEHLRTDAGPVADYIDQQIAGLRMDIDDLKVTLLNAIEGAKK